MTDPPRQTMVVGPALDGPPRSLILTVDSELLPTVHRWLPHGSILVDAHPEAGARILVGQERINRPAGQSGDPVLRLGRAAVWLDGTGENAWLEGAGGCAGSADLSTLLAQIYIPPISDGLVFETVYSMLTVEAALLLGRMGCALLHAGAVVPPRGGAWLVVGDARSGKSTTCMNLVTAGWQLLSDDQVVLVSDAEDATVCGWLRTIHMDSGWHSGTPTGVRTPFPVETIPPDRRRQSAPLAGILVSGVSPALATEVTPSAASDAFGQLVRQSPWLMADRGAAKSVLNLLTASACRPCFDLRLGLDSFHGPMLARVLSDRLAT